MVFLTVEDGYWMVIWMVEDCYWIVFGWLWMVIGWFVGWLWMVIGCFFEWLWTVNYCTLPSEEAGATLGHHADSHSWTLTGQPPRSGFALARRGLGLGLGLALGQMRQTVKNLKRVIGNRGLGLVMHGAQNHIQ